MNKSLVIVACLGLLLLAACSGRRPTRCDQWGWYKPCDLVEGRYAPQAGCADPCDPCNNYRAGQVVKREWAFPCQSPPMQTVEVPPPAVQVEPMPAPAE